MIKMCDASVNAEIPPVAIRHCINGEACLLSLQQTLSCKLVACPFRLFGFLFGFFVHHTDGVPCQT